MTDLETLDALVAAAATDAAALMNSTGLLLNELAAEKQAAGAVAEAARLEAERVAALPGQVNFFRYGGDPAYAALLKSATAEQRAHIVGHVDWLRVNSPFFDPMLDVEA